MPSSRCLLCLFVCLFFFSGIEQISKASVAVSIEFLIIQLLLGSYQSYRRQGAGGGWVGSSHIKVMGYSKFLGVKFVTLYGLGC